MRPLLVALLALPPLALAQRSNVICPQEALWAFNSLYQSPCIVGAYLLGACEDDPTQVFVTKGIATARPGDGLPANACSCSSVTYSLLSVCAYCAGAAHPMLWSAWSSECNPDVVQLKALPYWVPPGTAVPTWAFLDITKGNAFDFTTAGTTASLGEPDVLPSAAAAAGDSLPEPTPNMSPISPTANGRNNTRGSQKTDSAVESATEEELTRTRTHSPFPEGSAHTTAPPRGGTAVPIVAGVLGALAGVAALSSGIAWIVRRRSSRFAAISARPRRSSAHEKFRQQQQQQQLAFAISTHSHSRHNSLSHSRAQSLSRNAAIPLTAKSPA